MRLFRRLNPLQAQAAQNGRLLAQSERYAMHEQLVLSDIEGLSYEEVAQAMGSSLGTVKSRLSRARAKLRDFLLERQELLPSRYRLEND